MRLWLTIIAVFIAQEIVLMNATLLSAHQRGYSVLIMSLIFLAASIFDVLVGYLIGKLIQRRFSTRKIAVGLRQRAVALQDALGKRGSKMALTVLGFVNFNYVNAFFASWTTVPLRVVARYLILGDLLWYGAALAVVHGVSAFINPLYAMYVVIGISLAATMSGAFYHRRLLHNPAH